MIIKVYGKKFKSIKRIWDQKMIKPNLSQSQQQREMKMHEDINDTLKQSALYTPGVKTQ